MKRIRVILLVLCLCLLTACSNTTPDDEELQNAGVTTGVGQFTVPDSMKELAESPNVQWMAGVLVTLNNAEKIHGTSQESFAVFSCHSDVIEATITVQNGLNLSQQFDLMVFADGVPVDFYIEGKQYRTYPIELTPQRSSIELEFAKDFPMKMGRLDFVLSFAEDLRADGHLLTYSMWIDLADEPLSPTSLIDTIEQRSGLRGSYSGEIYNSWLWNEGVIPGDLVAMGPRTMTIQEKETVLLEAVLGQPGLYRTVLVVNGKPVVFEVGGAKCYFLDWESTGTNMLQVQITMQNIPATGCVYTIAIPLATDNYGQRILASAKVELVNDTER